MPSHYTSKVKSHVNSTSAYAWTRTYVLKRRENTPRFTSMATVSCQNINLTE